MRRRHHRRYQGRFTRLANLARSLTAPAAAGLLLASLFTAGTQAIAQTMTAPDITSEGPFLVDEGETAVATLTADDSDTNAGDLIWSKTGGADSGKFSLTSAGVLTFSAAKDYEAPQAGHKVDGVRPAFLSAAVNAAALTLTYGEALDEGSRPAPGDFTVQVDGSGRSVSGVSVSGRVVTLTLASVVAHESHPGRGGQRRDRTEQRACGE